MELQGKKFNFLGDSITEGWCGSGPVSKRYFDIVAEKTGAVCRGYGIGGTRIARQQTVRERIDELDFCRRAAEMDADADGVFVFGGTNDFGHGDAPFGSFADRTPDTFYGALHVLSVTLLERYPTAKIVFMTPTHRIEEDHPECNGHKGKVSGDLHPLYDYVKAIREVAAYYGIPVLDLWATSGIQPSVPSIRERYMPEGSHPNDAGHEKIRTCPCLSSRPLIFAHSPEWAFCFPTADGRPQQQMSDDQIY